MSKPNDPAQVAAEALYERERGQPYTSLTNPTIAQWATIIRSAYAERDKALREALDAADDMGIELQLCSQGTPSGFDIQQQALQLYGQRRYQAFALLALLGEEEGKEVEEKKSGPFYNREVPLSDILHLYLLEHGWQYRTDSHHVAPYSLRGSEWYTLSGAVREEVEREALRQEEEEANR